MPWARFDDDLLTNEKYLSVGPEAKLLWHTSIIYCAKNLTDGLVRSPVIPALGRLAGLTDLEAAKAELLGIGLWEEDEQGIRVHDFLDYNPSREEAQNLKAARAEAGSKGGRARASSLGLASAKQVLSKPLAKSYPVPGPVPGPMHDPIDPTSSVGAPEVAPTPLAAGPRHRVFAEDSEAYQLSVYLRDRILDNDSDARVPAKAPAKMAGWAGDMDLLIRVDKRAPPTIRAVIDWCQADQFWRSNILSPGSLRKQFTRLNLAREGAGRQNGKHRQEVDLDEHARSIAAALDTPSVRAADVAQWFGPPGP